MQKGAQNELNNRTLYECLFFKDFHSSDGGFHVYRFKYIEFRAIVFLFPTYVARELILLIFFAKKVGEK